MGDDACHDDDMVDRSATCMIRKEPYDGNADRPAYPAVRQQYSKLPSVLCKIAFGGKCGWDLGEVSGGSPGTSRKALSPQGEEQAVGMQLRHATL